jgi:hypothetical protein
MFYNSFDILYYFIFYALNNGSRIINVMLPYAACVFFFFLIALRFAGLEGWSRDVIAASAGMIGLTSASALSDPMTSVTEMTLRIFSNAERESAERIMEAAGRCACDFSAEKFASAFENLLKEFT